MKRYLFILLLPNLIIAQDSLSLMDAIQIGLQENYDIQISKLLSDNPIIKGELDLTNIRAFIRQINLNKSYNEVLKIKFDSNVNNDVDSEISFKSVNSKLIESYSNS